MANVTFGNRKPANGEICVHKFNDLNGNGVQDTGEPGLAGFVFQVTGGGVSTTITTNANGAACFGFPVGAYTVVETPKPGWVATTPTIQPVAVAPGKPTNVSFGNRLARGEICVIKFNDLNRNGIRDTGEPGLPGWVFQVTGGSSATLTTGPGGNVCSGFFVGAYTVVEMPQAGWLPTTPTSQTITVTAGQAANATFGNAR
jgi:uncharacterized protein (DUF2141 family)